MILERLNLPDLLEDEMKHIQEIDQKRKSCAVETHQNVLQGHDNSSTDIKNKPHLITSSAQVGQTNDIVRSNETLVTTYSSTSAKANENNIGNGCANSEAPLDHYSQVNSKTLSETSAVETVPQFVTNDNDDLSNVSLSDMLNSSSDETINSCKELPRVGISLGLSSQISQQSELSSSNFKVLPSNASTPVRPNKQQSGTKLMTSDNENVNTAHSSIKDNNCKTVIRQTIENRLTQMPRMEVDKDGTERSNVAGLTEEKHAGGSKLICVKEKKKKNIGEGRAVSAKVRKAMSDIEKNRMTVDKQISNDKQVDCDELLEKSTAYKRKKKRKKMEILSDASDDCEDSDLLQKKQRKSEAEHDNNKQSNVIATASTKIDRNDLKSKSVSESTLSKLKMFQFDESKSSILNSSASISLSKSLLSDTSLTNGNENTHDKQNVSEKASFDKDVDNFERPRNKDFELEKRKVYAASEECLKDKNSQINMTTDIDKRSENVKESASGNSKLDQNNKNSPSWLVTLNKKFSSPIINSCKNSPSVTPTFCVNDDKGDDLDNIDFEDSSFLTKLQTTNRSKP